MAGEIDGTGVLGVALSPCLATGIEGDEEPGKLKRRECSPLVVVTPLMLEFGTACETAEMLCDDETLANCDELILLSDEIGGTMGATCSCEMTGSCGTTDSGVASTAWSATISYTMTTSIVSKKSAVLNGLMSTPMAPWTRALSGSNSAYVPPRAMTRVVERSDAINS